MGSIEDLGGWEAREGLQQCVCGHNRSAHQEPPWAVVDGRGVRGVRDGDSAYEHFRGTGKCLTGCGLVHGCPCGEFTESAESRAAHSAPAPGLPVSESLEKLLDMLVIDSDSTSGSELNRQERRLAIRRAVLDAQDAVRELERANEEDGEKDEEKK